MIQRRHFIRGISAGLAGLALADNSYLARAAQGLSVSSSIPDPMVQYEYIFNGQTVTYWGNSGNDIITGKTPVVLNPAANNCVLVCFGDSLGENIVPTPFTPVNANCLNFNIYNGGTYALADPALGCSGKATPSLGCMFTRVADNIQGTGKFTNTILIPANIGGTLVVNWATDPFSRIKATFARLASRGLTATAVCIQLGANDSNSGTLQAAYTSQQAAMIAIIRLYFAGPVFIATESWFAGTTSAAVQAAQAAAVNHPSGIWAGPNTDSINATGRQADNIHWNDAGSATCAGLWLTALQAFGPPFT